MSTDWIEAAAKEIVGYPFFGTPAESWITGVSDIIRRHAPPQPEWGERPVDHLQKLYDASTPGEWYFSESVGDALEELVVNQNDEDVPVLTGEFIGEQECQDNWDFIAAAHNAMPRLLAEVRSLREECEEVGHMLGEEQKELAASQEREKRLRGILQDCKEADPGRHFLGDKIHADIDAALAKE